MTIQNKRMLVNGEFKAFHLLSSHGGPGAARNAADIARKRYKYVRVLGWGSDWKVWVRK